ncbi:MAG: hypothetical protein M3P97_05285 [Actinomycetota bacterium]|jgi:hypothetical protein|nr:hypothetical protein [Actinomycetota bacterium]
MGAQRTSFAKLQRDRAKKAKAAAKREERQERASTPGEDRDAPDLGGGTEELSAPELLSLIEQIHRQLDAEQITFEEFEERKIELLARLPVD